MKRRLPGNAFSFLAPAVQYGKYGAVLTLEILGQRWGGEKTKVWRFFQKHGVLADLKIDDEKLRRARQEKVKNSYHNTLVQLRHYRTIAWVMECFPETVAEELEARMEGVQKSRLLIDWVNEALTALKKKLVDGERLHNLIYLTYIALEQLSHNELLYRLDDSIIGLLVQNELQYGQVNIGSR